MSVNEIVGLIELRTQQQKKPQGGHGTTAESSSSSSPESSLSCTSELDAVSSSYVGGGLVLLTPSNASEEKTRAAGPQQQQQHVDFGFDLSAIDHLNWTWPEELGGGEGTSEGLWSGLRDLAGDSRELDGIDQVSMEWVGEWQSPWQ